MIPITPDMVQAGVKIVSGLINTTVEAIAKIKASKDSKIQYIKDEATAAENILIAYTEEYKRIWNTLAIEEKPQFDFINKCLDYIKNNPPPKDFGKLGGSTTSYGLSISFQNNSIKLLKVPANTVIYELTNSGNTKIYNQQIRLPLVWVENEIKKAPIYNEYMLATSFLTTGTRLPTEVVEKWKNGVQAAAEITATQAAEKAATDRKAINKKYIIALIIVGILAIGGVSLYFLYKRKN